MNILLLGAHGQLGRSLQQALPALGTVTAWSRNDLDLTDAGALAAKLSGRHDDVIVNAAAYTAVDLAETDEARAHAVNATAVDALARHAATRGALLVHYSTDYIFDGRQARAYREDDPPAPLNAYGRSKLAGEHAIARRGCRTLVMRLSWLVSPTGHNFIKTILRLAAERDALRVVDDQHGAPTSAALVAATTCQALSALGAGRLSAGTYHLAAAGRTTWHELARHVLARARRNGIQLRADADDVAAISSADYPAPARRPRNSSLDCGKLTGALGLRLPDWAEGVDAVVDQLTRSERQP